MINRLFISLVLLFPCTSIINAQTAQTGRGAFSPETPYGIPDDIQTRGRVFVVNTTSDDDYNNGNTCDPDAGAGLTLREAIEDCSSLAADATIFVPAGLYMLQDDLDSSYEQVAIIGEDPLTTIIDNINNDTTREAGRGLSFSLGTGQFATIANLTFRDSDANFSSSNLGGGGLLVTGSGGRLTLHNLIFDSNAGADGGGVSVEGDLHLTGTSLTFTDNRATDGSGGGLYFNGVFNSSTISISDSVFTGNTASNSGGALYILNIDNVLFSNVTIRNNAATGQPGGGPPGSGGGIFLNFARASFVNTEIALNAAGTLTDIGKAGGLYSTDVAYLYYTKIEDNTDDYGTPDCYVDVETLKSLGNNAIGNLFLCEVDVHETDQYNNLLDNGGFEEEGATSKAAASWTVNAPGAVRVCNKTGKSASGVCALKLSSTGKMKQNADLTDVVFGASDVLKLFAEGLGKAASNASVKVIVAYGDGTPKDKETITFSGAGASTGFDSASVSLPLSSANVSKVVVKIANSSGKLFLDRVYLFVDLSGVTRGPLPVPAAPTTLRHSN